MMRWIWFSSIVGALFLVGCANPFSFEKEAEEAGQAIATAGQIAASGTIGVTPSIGTSLITLEP